MSYRDSDNNRRSRRNEVVPWEEERAGRNNWEDTAKAALTVGTLLVGAWNIGTEIYQMVQESNREQEEKKIKEALEKEMRRREEEKHNIEQEIRRRQLQLIIQKQEDCKREQERMRAEEERRSAAEERRRAEEVRRNAALKLMFYITMAAILATVYIAASSYLSMGGAILALTVVATIAMLTVNCINAASTLSLKHHNKEQF